MKLRLLLIALFLCACAVPQPVETDSTVTSGGRYDPNWVKERVSVFHDDKNSVTCWIYIDLNSAGLDCIPDWQLEKPE